MNFEIGDRVMVRSYEDLPEEVKNVGLGKSAGKRGEIVDVLYSNLKSSYIYKVRFDGNEYPSKTEFPEEVLLDLSEQEKTRYVYEFEVLENLVVARLYEVNEDEKREIVKGHGHIFHDGLLGIAQASSYALKMIYKKLEEKENE